MLKTSHCVMCGEKATAWCGFVLAKERMALGNYIPVKILAGFCDGHIETAIHDTGGNYGCYNPKTMGECVPFNIR